MSAHAPAVADERTALHAFLRQQQQALRNAVFGLTDEQAGQHPTASSLSIGSLLKHVTLVSGNWLDAAVSAPAPAAFGPDAPGAMEAWTAAWAWTESDTVAAALRAYDQVCDAVLEAVGSVDLEIPVPVPDAPWFPRDVEAWSVRWVWFHLIEEVARHAGHADIVRESVDGAGAIELLAARESWPANGFITPWRAPVAV